MKYKVGDRVRVKSREWYDKNKDERGTVSINHLSLFLNPFLSLMSEYCGKIATITECHPGFSYYRIDLDGGNYAWSEGAFEDSCPEEQLIKDIACVIKSHSLEVAVSEKDGKLIIEPLKDEKDLPIGTPCMVLEEGEFCLRYYAGNKKCFCDGYRESISGTSSYKYIIPFDKFDPNDIGKSLKYNIVIK